LSFNENFDKGKGGGEGLVNRIRDYVNLWMEAEKAIGWDRGFREEMGDGEFKSRDL
jgi:hypothetical protein